MKAVANFECLFTRGKRETYYLRRRIPTAIRAAYPPKQIDISFSLGTADSSLAEVRFRREMCRLDEEFAEKRKQVTLSGASVGVKRVVSLDEAQLTAMGQFWLRQVLAADDARREQGLDDSEFDELGALLENQRSDLGRMMAQGKSLGVLPALREFLYLCGLDFQPSEAEAKRACYAFARSLAKTLDHQLSRQRGAVVETADMAPEALHPMHVAFPSAAPAMASKPSWELLFETWRDYVPERPKSTTIASQTPWSGLRIFAEERGALLPGDVTPMIMTEFVTAMRARGLAVETVNERIRKIRAIYKIATGRHLLTVNPALDTLGYKESSFEKRRKHRLPFDVDDLQVLFSSEVFTLHTRSQGQSGEASYWIPVLMYYTGARPEELAGLALSDLCYASEFGCFYLRIIDRPTLDDEGLFDDVPESHRRTLKNQPSIRNIPVAQELVDLGLLKYVEWLKASGEAVFFPTLGKDWHGKLSGAFGKFFGRYLRAVGISANGKVLYSFRHTMKDLLEQAKVPSKYLKRMLGHTSGDGDVTDGYGSDLPLEHMVEYFSKVKFPALPALPWEPGRGPVRWEQDTGG